LVEIVGISPSANKLSVRLKSVARVGAALALLGAAPAAAAPVELPVPLPPPRVEANEVDQAALVPRVSVGDGGLQLVTWRSGNARALVALNGSAVIRARTSKTAVASVRYARTRVLHLDARRLGAYRGFPTVQLGYRLGKADLSNFGSEREIGGKRTIRGDPVLAVNADGSAIAAWHHVRAGRSDEIQVAWRFAGGKFSKPRTVRRANVDDEATVAVGIDTRGRAVVAYASGGEIAERVIHTKSGWVSAESRVPVPAGQHGPTEITVGTGQPGLVVVAWRGYPVSEGPSGTVDAAASVIGVGSNQLGPAQALATGNLVAYPRGPIVATVDADGRPVVAFTVPMRPGVAVPTVVQGDNAGRFGAPQALDSSGSIGALIRQDEGLAVGWLRETPGVESHGEPLGVYVARRGVSGPFGPAELVDDQSSGRDADGLQPPGLGELPSGGLLAVYADIGDNEASAQVRASTR
jgi:hypothetical protein